MNKYDLLAGLAPGADIPILNAAGSLGFSPSSTLLRAGQPTLHAFVTNPISLGARSPANGPRFGTFPGGFLLHTGYPNPGWRAVLRRHAVRWARSPLPIIVHFLAQTPDEIASIRRDLERLDGVIAVEMGLPPQADAAAVRQLALAGSGELALIVRLPLERALEWADAALSGGAAAISLGAPRGAFSGPDGKLHEGRMYGPAVLPQTLQVTRQLAAADVPVIAGPGIYRQADIALLRAAGAQAAQLDTALWRGGLA